MIVLGIETSCDETGVAFYCSEQGLIAHQIYSQITLHAQYGGVVPELASRDHLRKLPVLVNAALEEAGLVYADIDGIAFTEGPGLIGALMVGAMYAQGLSYALSCPLIGIHHMEAHLMAVMLEEHKPAFPFVALLVSGGHTQLIHVKAFGVYEVLGDTLDDAVGEAFDKTAKLMGIPYPGGALLAEMAEQGDPHSFGFPRPMLDRPGLDFSFSGLKTKALLTLKSEDSVRYPDIAASFQIAIVETLIQKCMRAIKATGVQQLVVAGGVGANKLLRAELTQMMSAQNIAVFFPRQLFCTDNGAMVAYLGHERLMRQQMTTEIKLKARWPLSDLNETSM